MLHAGEIFKAIDAAGQSIDVSLNEKITESGEGQIWRTSRKGELAKIYLSKDSLALRTEKLKTMIEFPPKDPAAPGISIAWPKMILKDVSGATAGFLMPEIANAERTTVFYNAKERKTRAPSMDWFYLHKVAENIAVVCRSLHDQGYVIGDLKADNWLIDRNMMTVVIDTDSFQVRHPHTTRLYHCPVGSPDYCAPETFGKDFATLKRTPEHDRFAMAILIYQLLFGRHPFSGGEFVGRGEPLTVTSDRILNGQWLWKVKGDFRARPADLRLDALHPALAKLMRRAFDDGHLEASKRPTAKEWEDALDAALSAMAWCDKEQMHVYGGHESSCTWCAIKKNNGFDTFSTKPGVTSKSFAEIVTGPFDQAMRNKNYRQAQDMITRHPKLKNEPAAAKSFAEFKKWEWRQKPVPVRVYKTFTASPFAKVAAAFIGFSVLGGILYPQYLRETPALKKSSEKPSWQTQVLKPAAEKPAVQSTGIPKPITPQPQDNVGKVDPPRVSVDANRGNPPVSSIFREPAKPPNPLFREPAPPPLLPKTLPPSPPLTPSVPPRILEGYAAEFTSVANFVIRVDTVAGTTRHDIRLAGVRPDSTEAYIRRISQYTAGKKLNCVRQPDGKTFRCRIVEGNDDLASYLIGEGYAEASQNAPFEYMQLQTQARLQYKNRWRPVRPADGYGDFREPGQFR